MGTTLWIHILEGLEYSRDRDNHTLMHKHAESLDAIYGEAEVRKLSEFFNFPDLEYSYAEVDDGSDEEPPVDPEAGLGYGIDDMTWFKAAKGRCHRCRVLRVKNCNGFSARMDCQIQILPTMKGARPPGERRSASSGLSIDATSEPWHT